MTTSPTSWRRHVPQSPRRTSPPYSGPRWLPLTPALIGAATPARYGVLGLAYCALATAGVTTMRKGDFPTSGDALLVSWAGMIAFAVYGVALTVAVRSYWLRTRPIDQVPVPTGRAR
ncbi:hypothetical protein ACIHEJ_38105 [Streptomyces sp. NPDC052301]|uniref:hypothetical protein n=1 Tax=Streptomyces sp. NPDC052301 TaxID=3365687 RepID=UPI0037D5BD7F